MNQCHWSTQTGNQLRSAARAASELICLQVKLCHIQKWVHLWSFQKYWDTTPSLPFKGLCSSTKLGYCSSNAFWNTCCTCLSIELVDLELIWNPSKPLVAGGSVTPDSVIWWGKLGQLGIVSATMQHICLIKKRVSSGWQAVHGDLLIIEPCGSNLPSTTIHKNQPKLHITETGQWNFPLRQQTSEQKEVSDLSWQVKMKIIYINMYSYY